MVDTSKQIIDIPMTSADWKTIIDALYFAGSQPLREGQTFKKQILEVRDKLEKEYYAKF